jgi:RAB protein geranylgeranyltransferase component A
MPKAERRKSMAERRPSMSYTPPVIPHLAGLEKPQDLILKLEETDVLILGTGLQESILAAALSWNGTNVLHVDSNTFYGDSSATLTIEQLKKWVLEVNMGKFTHFQDAQIYIPGSRTTNKFNSKDYGIEISPKIMFCKSDLLSLLLKSRVYKYLEFQSLSQFHTFENDDFQQQNLSNQTMKSNIFMDKSLSLHTKRYLMKFLKFVLQDNNDESKKIILAENSKTPIEEFLQSQFNLQLPQVNEIIYSIGLCVKASTKTPEALARIKRFLVSFDVYGNFPVMVSKYGGPGEISQGFCRSAAVAGTTYKLTTKLVDYDPVKKIAKFSDGAQVRINEKVVISPTQIPKFLKPSYQEISSSLPVYNVTRLTTVVRNDCKEWMAENESSTIVVFPPGSLPTNNTYSVQVIIQNGGTGVCPMGQSVWFSHSIEQDLNRAKADLEAAYEKMEQSILRESTSNSDIDDMFEHQEIVISQQGTPIIANSFKLGESLQSFVPKMKLDIVCKLGYVQKTFINPDLSTTFKANEDKDINNITLKCVPDTDDIIFTNMPSSEVSYDGIITETKLIYQRITGTDEDFFDVDFEDEEDDLDTGANTGSSISAQSVINNKPSGVNGGVIGGGVTAYSDTEMAIEDDSDDDGHQPFGANEMEL